MPSFHDFLLQPATRAVLATMEIIEPTPIQAEAIPALLAGNDLVGQSATGSGKTLAYGIPLVERVARDKRVVQALVLVPTRELAIQVDAVLGKLASGRRLSTALLVGGRPYGKQLAALRYGAQMVVGTPGRVKDHLDRGTLALDELRVCVLDEADQMLDSGFAPAIEEILTTTPDTRQTALFSATMPDWIATLQQKFLNHPVTVSIKPATGAQTTIEPITYQLRESSELFTRRVGRTGRMGRQGKAITLLTPSEVPQWRRIVRSLGQSVALQRLALDEEAIGTLPLAKPEAAAAQEHEQNGEQRPVRNRTHFSADQQRGRRAHANQASHAASSLKRQQQGRVPTGTPARTPARQQEGFPLPERPYSGRVRDSRRGAGKQSSFGRTTGKRKAPAVAPRLRRSAR